MMPGLQHGPLDAAAVHLCIDMQRLFAPGSPWQVPWLVKILSRVERFAEAVAAQTIFTRFIPPPNKHDVPGTWRRFYERWDELTLHRIDPDLLELVEPLQAFCPPAPVLDRWRYSCFTNRRLGALLRERRSSAIVVTGGESDVCVLATVMDAVDLGYRVVIATDGVCSSADSTHDAIMSLYHARFSQQIETASLEEIRDAWRS